MSKNISLWKRAGKGTERGRGLDRSEIPGRNIGGARASDTTHLATRGRNWWKVKRCDEAYDDEKRGEKVEVETEY